MALTTAFARNGNRKAVPQTTADGSVSYEQGFGNLYALPPEEGGLFIDRAQFNQIMYDTTSAVITNQNSISTLNSKVTANQNSINTLNSKVADLESGVSTGVVNLTGNQTIAGVKTFSSPPISATNPTANNQVANKAYVDTVGNTAVKLTGNQTIAGVKTFSSPVVVPNATANTHAVNLSQLNTKANANATVNLTGNQSIAGAKTFTSNITAPNITAMQNSINTLTTQAEQAGNTLNTALQIFGSRALGSRKIITVGTSGADYNNLIDAINEAIKYQNSVRESNVLSDGFGGWNVTEVIVRLTTDLEISSSIRITLSCGFLTIDLNKKTIYCTGNGAFAIGRPNALIQIVNGSIIKKNYSAPYQGTAISSYGLCLIGQAASFIDGNVDNTPGANGFVTIKGFEKGLWNGYTGMMQIQANISDCLICVYHANSVWTNIVDGTYSSNQSDGASATPLYAINGGNLVIWSGTISSNISSGSTARPCIYVNSGTTVTILNYVTINNQGIATKCNIASNTLTPSGIIYTSLF